MSVVIQSIFSRLHHTPRIVFPNLAGASTPRRGTTRERVGKMLIGRTMPRAPRAHQHALLPLIWRGKVYGRMHAEVDARTARSHALMMPAQHSYRHPPARRFEPNCMQASSSISSVSPFVRITRVAQTRRFCGVLSRQ